MEPPGDFLVAIAGACGAGKTTLARSLLEHGINARAIAQEHSYVPDMWQKITKPDLLIFLDVSYEVTITRRQLNWTLSEFNQQQVRLKHARAGADKIIHTDHLSPGEVFAEAMAFLAKNK
jgi:thymidylate kinase